MLLRLSIPDDVDEDDDCGALSPAEVAVAASTPTPASSFSSNMTLVFATDCSTWHT